MLYRIIFTDETDFIGISYKNTRWNKIPDKSIKQINFFLPDGNIFTLHGFEEYNHFIEATNDFYAGKKNNQNVGKTILRFQYLMGRLGDKVVSYRITLYQSDTSKYKTGDITRRVYQFGKEYNGKPTLGWKKGIKNG